jgi:hypothetical protein
MDQTFARLSPFDNSLVATTVQEATSQYSSQALPSLSSLEQQQSQVVVSSLDYLYGNSSY